MVVGKDFLYSVINIFGLKKVYGGNVPWKKKHAIGCKSDGHKHNWVALSNHRWLDRLLILTLGSDHKALTQG